MRNAKKKAPPQKQDTTTATEKRKGRQTPTVSHILPYTQTKGAEAVKLYNKSNRKSMPWQELLLADIMAVNDEGLWVHMKFGYSIPRRNGKSELLIPRVVWGLVNGEKVLYTAHRTTTSHSAWERICKALSDIGYTEGEDYKTTKQFGLEHIEMLNGEGVTNFRTRSSKGGLGEGYDLLIIDEAQEYTADQETALKYVVTDSKNPQTLMCGTPPTVVSSGTVFQKYRKNLLTGQGEDEGWAEWGVLKKSDPHNVELWYETNPSLGLILTERNIRSELGDDDIDNNIQRLGLWLQYNQKSAISREEWESYRLTEKPTILNGYFFAVRYESFTGNVALSVAVKTTDGKIFIECIDCRPIKEGNAWILRFLQSSHCRGVYIDGSGNQQNLADEIKAAKIKCKVTMPTQADMLRACAGFEQALYAGGICHMGQPSLTQAIANTDKKTYERGGFVYAPLYENIDISLVKSVVLAFWYASTTKERKAQKIKY